MCLPIVVQNCFLLHRRFSVTGVLPSYMLRPQILGVCIQDSGCSKQFPNFYIPICVFLVVFLFFGCIPARVWFVRLLSLYSLWVLCLPSVLFVPRTNVLIRWVFEDLTWIVIEGQEALNFLKTMNRSLQWKS